MVQTDGAGAAQQSRGGAAVAWAGQRFSALSSCHRPRRAAPLCCGAAGGCLWEGCRVKKAGWQCNPSGELLHCIGLACPHCLQPLSAPRACLCTVPTSGLHKCPPMATGSFFAQVVVSVDSEHPQQVHPLARPSPAPCAPAFSDFIFPCHAPCAGFRGGGGVRFSTRFTPIAAAASLYLLHGCRIDADLAATHILFRWLSVVHARIRRALGSRAGRTVGQVCWAGKVLPRQAHFRRAGKR